MLRRLLTDTLGRMPRRLRCVPGGMAYHVLNRAVGRNTLFEDDGDYAAFEKVLGEACKREKGMSLFVYCLMPNHWHLVLRPNGDEQLSRFMQWLTVTHTRRWHAHHGTGGSGPLYQGRFKSFPVQCDVHFLVACRYVERNGVRAKLARRARAWLWCSAAWRAGRAKNQPPPWLIAPAAWPVEVPPDWEEHVDRPETDGELEAVRKSVQRGAPFGSDKWVTQTAARLRLGSTLRPPHRPRKEPAAGAGRKEKES